MSDDQASPANSLLMRSALSRIGVALLLVGGLWLAVAWALSA